MSDYSWWYITSALGFYFLASNAFYIIECHGEQHFRQIPHSQKTEKDFLETRQRDLLKNWIAEVIGSILIRIDYTWFHRDELEGFIQMCLDNILSYQSLITTSPELYL